MTFRNKDVGIHTRFILFCDYALVSSDGKLSIIGEFDHLFSTSDKPVLHKAFLVASLTTTPKKEVNLKIQLVDEAEKNKMFEKSVSLTSGQDGKVNIMIGLENMVFEKTGLFKALISSEGEKVAEAKLHVMQVKKQNAAQA